MICSRSEEDFATRLTVNETKLDRVNVSKILGVWVRDDLSWSTHCSEKSKQAYICKPFNVNTTKVCWSEYRGPASCLYSVY